MARRLRLESARFLDKELFTDLPDGARRELDVVAEVEAGEGQPEVILVHVEVEARARPEMARRLWRYSMQLRLRYDRPVLSIVLYLSGGPRGVRLETLRERFGELELAVFRYLAFGLSRAKAQEYLARPQPLAWALACRMDPGEQRPEEILLRCLRNIARAGLDEARCFLLAHCAYTYVEWTAEATMSYQELIKRQQDPEVTELALSLADRLRQEGIEQGREEGMRQLLLRLLERRFGPLGPEVRARVEAIHSVGELTRLADRVLDARSLADMGLD